MKTLTRGRPKNRINHVKEDNVEPQPKEVTKETKKNKLDILNHIHSQINDLKTHVANYDKTALTKIISEIENNFNQL